MKYGKWKAWNDDGEQIPTGKVQIQLRLNNRIESENRKPECIMPELWKHVGQPYDIIAYREVIEPEVRTWKCWAYAYKGVSPSFYNSQVNDVVVRGTYTATIDPETDKPTRIVWEADE